MVLITCIIQYLIEDRDHEDACERTLSLPCCFADLSDLLKIEEVFRLHIDSSMVLCTKSIYLILPSALILNDLISPSLNDAEQLKSLLLLKEFVVILVFAFELFFIFRKSRTKYPLKHLSSLELGIPEVHALSLRLSYLPFFQ